MRRRAGSLPPTCCRDNWNLSSPGPCVSACDRGGAAGPGTSPGVRRHWHKGHCSWHSFTASALLVKALPDHSLALHKPQPHLLDGTSWMGTGIFCSNCWKSAWPSDVNLTLVSLQVATSVVQNTTSLIGGIIYSFVTDHLKNKAPASLVVQLKICIEVVLQASFKGI